MIIKRLSISTKYAITLVITQLTVLANSAINILNKDSLYQFRAKVAVHVLIYGYYYNNHQLVPTNLLSSQVNAQILTSMLTLSIPL